MTRENSPQPRFVVLRHELPATAERPSHFDLMFELGGILRTWSVPHELIEGVSQVATLLPDHRIHYLDYQGPLSGDRGTVSRWDNGTYEPHETSEHRFTAIVQGARLSGMIALQRDAHSADHAWQVSYTHESSTRA